MYYIYILRCNDHSLYTGITNNIEKRMHQHFHKEAAGAKYTKSHPPLYIEAIWQCENRSKASKLEYHIKKLTKKKKEALILSHDLSVIESINPLDYYFISFKNAL
ncbi:MAG TPA: GIY-YIG nuclease family protein [Kandleria vitulina]|nr:GIY-YIG nuclease family protein [Kandleria vitulina]HCY53122.1 GIY-YIG nuclease family protein [Kandleria vitulina]